MANERKVDLRVRAKDEFSGSLNKLEAAQKKIIEQNRKIAQMPPGDLRRFYQETTREVEAAQTKIGQLAQEFRALSQAEGDNRAAMGKLLIEKSKLQAKAGELRASLEGVRQASHQLRTSQEGGFRAFNQTATAMEREAQATRALAAARDAAATRLRNLIDTRAANPVQSGFNQFSAGAEARVVAQQEERAAAMAARRSEAQNRLNNQAKSGFAAWSQYADAISRLAQQEERAATMAARREALQQRLNAQAAGGFLAFSRAADGLTQQASAATRSATQLNLVNNAAKKAATAQDQLRAATDRAGAALDRQSKRPRGDSGGRRGEDQDVELYGLRPYQMVNLGYQLNDVISGLAMGQAPVQILAQQAGQFAQIWPNMMVGLVRSLPVFAGLTAALSPFIAALIRVRTEANSLRTFTTNLALMADGSRYSAQGLAEMTAELDRAGVAVDEARQGILALTKEGIDEAQIKAITDLAKELAKLSGNKFSDEVARLSTAFTGNAASVRELDRELQFLTADQLEQIYALEKAGNATGAMELAQAALRNRLAATRQELTPWQQAIKDVGDAWSTFVDLVAESQAFKDFLRDIGQLAKEFQMIAKGIKAASDYIEGAINPTPDQRYDKLLKRRAELMADMDGVDMSDPFAAMKLQVVVDDLVDVNREIAELERELEAAASAAEDAGDATSAATAESQEQLKLKQDLQQVLDAQLEKLREEAELVTQSAKEQFVQNQLLEAKNEALERGLELTEDQIEALRRQAEATYAASVSPVATGDFGGVVDRIVGVESGGNALAKNPLSSATGLGQFIESTWLTMFRKHFPDRAESMTEGAILALRNDAALSRQMIELYARENAAIMQQAGVAVNDAAVYLAHFLGPGGAVATLSAAPDTLTDAFLGQDQISANASILRGKTAAEVVAWAEKKMAITDQELEVVSRISEIEQDRAKEVADYNEGYAKRIADQKFELQLATETARQAAIMKAVRAEELRAQEAGLTLSRERRAEVAATAAALFDQQNAETRVNELMEQRSLLAESLQIAQQAGDSAGVQQVVEQIRQTEAELDIAIDKAIQFYEAMGGPAADQAILKLQNLKGTIGSITQDLDTQFLPTAEELNEGLADIGSGAFSAFAQSVAEGENALKSMFEAARQGFADLLIQIGQAIVKQAIFNAISGGTAGGGVGGSLAGSIGGLFGTRHTGGMVGAAAPTRMVNPAVFANAAIHHSGGLVGRERAIIALEDEEVLTRGDPRHTLNGGASPAVNTKVVNVFDPADVLEAALETSAGEKIIMNWMSRNAARVNGALS